METDDLTIHVLREIRDEIRGTNSRVDSLTAGVDHLETHLSERIDQTNVRIDRLTERVVESEIRTATAITGLAGTLDDVRDLLKDRLDLRDRVERCERDIDELKRAQRP